MPSNTTDARESLDRLGVALAIGCALHCAVAPIVLIAAPLLGGIWVHPGSHMAIAALALPVAAHTLRKGFSRHGQWGVLGTGLFGMTLVVLGVILPLALSGGDAEVGDVCRECCPTTEIDVETGAYTLSIPPASLVSFLGGIALMLAHLANLRGCRAACCERKRPRLGAGKPS